MLTFNRSICRAALQTQEPAVVICDLKTDHRNVMKFLWHYGPSFNALMCRAQGIHPSAERSASLSSPALWPPKAELPCSHISFTIRQCHHSRLAESAHSAWGCAFPSLIASALPFPRAGLSRAWILHHGTYCSPWGCWCYGWNCRAVCQGCGVNIKLPAANLCPQINLRWSKCI